eukprot:2969442-Amphidinium_carterae.1
MFQFLSQDWLREQHSFTAVVTTDRFQPSNGGQDGLYAGQVTPCEPKGHPLNPVRGSACRLDV